jgi:hypothetical protein
MRLIASALIGLVALTPVEIRAAVEGCMVFLHLHTDERYVSGPIEAECPCIGPFCHSVPFGNWGVETPWSSREDGNQFPGWKQEDDGTEEWNSCTTDAWFEPPHPTYFNHPVPGWYAQSSTEGVAVHNSGLISFGQNISCSVLNGAPFTLESHSIDVYELDPGSDQFLGSLTYPDQSVVLECSGSGSGATCVKATPFINPTWGPSAFTAKARIGLTAYWGSPF